MKLRRRNKREVPTLNTTSTADISFMLLIFFLVTTSMESEKGLQRRLPPSNPDERQQQFMDVKADRVLTITITPDRKILADGKPMGDADLQKTISDFVVRVGKEHILQLEASPNADYATYFHLQNIVARVYSKLRNDYALKAFHRPLNDCSEQQRKQVREAVPQRLAEEFSLAASSAEQTIGDAIANKKEGGQK